MLVDWVGSYVLVGFARQFNPLALPKAGYRIGLTSLLLLAGAGSVHDATALNETRTLSFHHTHSDEDLTVTFKRDGRYDEEALKKINHFLRDWRSQDSTTMDRHLFDILWEVYRDVDGKKPIQIISAYRSPATNAMLRRRSSGVARFSQHMLGHAMDFYIPDVPLEQIRAAGLRLQRGGVGFYPTSGSPFVHLDTGSIRHWPRMTQDQLARVFPDGRTVHLPSNGGPMKGYELARADIERRGNGDDAASVGKKPSLFAALFRGGKSTEEDDEGGNAPIKNEKSTPASVTTAKSADPVPTPRAKPVGSTIQLASADAQIVSGAKAKPESKPEATQASAEPKPQTPADIINSRGFWDDVPKAANQATPAQVAALRARQALAAATDPQPTASVTESFNKAMAYAPAATSPVDRANVVAATAPIPPRPARPARNAGAAATEINTVVAKGAQGQDSVVATSTRLAAAQGNSIWMRVVMLAPSASNAMSTTVLGDTEMTQMRSHFVKPPAAIAMTFSEDPMMGMTCDRFTGSATAQLPTQSFVMRTAALR
jgi:uncharacterized protein YcbK (DUF882 family)